MGITKPTSDPLGSGRFSPAVLPRNVFLGLLLFLIAGGVLLTYKVLPHQIISATWEELQETEQ